MNHSQRAIDAIRKAFAGTTAPNLKKLARSRDDEQREIANLLRFREWTDFDDQLVLSLQQAIFFLPQKAFIYYLPGFMTASLKYYDIVDTIPDEVLFSLAPPQLDTQLVADIQTGDFTILSRQQVHAVCLFLHALIQDHAEDYTDDLTFYAAKEVWCDSDEIKQ